MDDEYSCSHRQLRAALLYARRELAKQPLAAGRKQLLKRIDGVIDEAKWAAAVWLITRIPKVVEIPQSDRPTATFRLH